MSRRVELATYSAVAAFVGSVAVSFSLGALTVGSLITAFVWSVIAFVSVYLMRGRWQAAREQKTKQQEEDDALRLQQEWDEAHWNSRGR
jgi:membrane protein implicated in regulation of membrane protease activity